MLKQYIFLYLFMYICKKDDTIIKKNKRKNENEKVEVKDKKRNMKIT